MTADIVNLHPTTVAVANAVSFLIDRDGRATVRGVAGLVGRSLSATHEHLHRLSGMGFIDWTAGKHATIHLTVERVDVKAAS